MCGVSPNNNASGGQAINGAIRARAKCCLRPVLLYPHNLPSPDNPQCDAVILPVNIDSEDCKSIQDYRSLPAAVVHLGVPEFPKVSPA